MGQLNKAGGTQTRLQTSSTGEAYLVDQRGTGAGLRISSRGTALQADVTHSATAVAVNVASTGHGMAISAYRIGLAVQADGGVGSFGHHGERPRRTQPFEQCHWGLRLFQ